MPELKFRLGINVAKYLYSPLISSGSQSGHTLDWRSRLDVAAKIAEALAYMHEELGDSGIAHGNLNRVTFCSTRI